MINSGSTGCFRRISCGAAGYAVADKFDQWNFWSFERLYILSCDLFNKDGTRSSLCGFIDPNFMNTFPRRRYDQRASFITDDLYSFLINAIQFILKVIVCTGVAKVNEYFAFF